MDGPAGPCTAERSGMAGAGAGGGTVEEPSGVRMWPANFALRCVSWSHVLQNAGDDGHVGQRTIAGADSQSEHTGAGPVRGGAATAEGAFTSGGGAATGAAVGALANAGGGTATTEGARTGTRGAGTCGAGGEAPAGGGSGCPKGMRTCP